MASVDYKIKSFKAEEMTEVFTVVNASGVTRMGMPGDYKIIYEDMTEEVMNKEDLEKMYEVDTP